MVGGLEGVNIFKSFKSDLFKFWSMQDLKLVKKVNAVNVKADRLTFGKWNDLTKDYFSNEKIIHELYAFFEKQKINLGKEIEIVEVGSAEGLVGEYFKKKLKKDRRVHLTILDVVKEHLEKNRNKETKKVHLDLLKFNEIEKYGLVIMRSVLHYFSEEEQEIVLKNVYHSLKKGGYLLLSVFIQYPSSMNLFLELNKAVGKNLTLLSKEEVQHNLFKAGFENVKFLGELTTWNCSSGNLKKRYNLSKEKIELMRRLIEKTPLNGKQGFTVSKEGFSVPIPYKLFLMTKN